jgi:hypothetical protein
VLNAERPTSPSKRASSRPATVTASALRHMPNQGQSTTSGPPPPTNEGRARTGPNSRVLSDTSREVQHLSTRSAPVIVTPVCLTDAIRSQGFSPSQRFDPTGASWLCFKPLPPIGFGGLQSFSRLASRRASRHAVLSCRSTATPELLDRGPEDRTVPSPRRTEGGVPPRL